MDKAVKLKAEEMASLIATYDRLQDYDRYEGAIAELAKLLHEHAAMKVRCDALDELQRNTVAR